MDHADIWTLAEVNKQGRLHTVSSELLAWGRGLADTRGCRLCSVVLGNRIPQEDIDDLIARGADRVYLVEHPALEDFLVEPHAGALLHLVQQYQPEVFIAAATTTGRTVMPYLSAKVPTGLTADCTGLEIDPDSGNLHQTRPAIGGNIMATIKTPEARPQMATVRPRSAKPAARIEGRSGEIVRVAVPDDMLQSRMRYERFIPDESTDGAIEEANVIVAGGRGVQNKENFALLGELAGLLGGVVGVSRACVEAGWQTYPRQVGMSGKTVLPQLYIACGISGAIHHLVGMQTSEHIIAINNDPNAQIFQVADFGIVGDMFDLLPPVIEKIRSNGGGK